MNEIITQQNFYDRMKDRIKEDLGKLMTDEELSELVHRFTKDIFFKERTVTQGYNTKTLPPILHEFIQELLKDQVKEAVIQYIAENKDEVNEIISKTISSGMVNALMEAIQEFFCSPIRQLERAIEEKVGTLNIY